MTQARREFAGKIAITSVLIVGAAAFALPFFWLLSSSLKTPAQIWVFPPEFIPRPLALSNYPEALTVLPFGIYLRNTLLVVLVRVLGVVLTSSFCAYGFARLRFFGRDIIFMLVLSTIMVPTAVLIIPRYVMFRQLDWIDTFYPLTVPYLFGGSAFNVFLLRQFFRTIPADLTDAAKMDGCSHLRIYWSIMLPLAKPALATIAIFVFLFAWNEFLAPLLYLSSPDKLTVAVGLQQFRGSYGTDWHLLMAASTAMTLPVVVMFFLGQRYFIEGAVITGLKG